VTDQSPPEINNKHSIPHVRLDANILLIFGVTLMAVLGVSSISPVLPRIMRELSLTEWEVGLLFSFFTVPGVILAPFVGIFGDRWGRKKILLPALFLFGIAGGACAFTTNFRIMLLLRSLQGIGATALGILNFTILSDLYKGKNRTVVLGYNMSVLSTGTASYPLIGGTLALLGWRYPFMLPFVAIPLGILVFIFLKNPEPKNNQLVGDYIRNTLKSLKRVKAVGLFMLSMMTFVLLYGAFITYFSILLGKKFGASTFTTGLMMFISSVSTAVSAAKIGSLIEKMSETTILKIGYILIALSLMSIPFVTSIWLFVIPMILLGTGMGINTPCIMSMLTTLAPFEYRASFLSVNTMMLRMGQTLGPLVMGIIFGMFGFEGVFFTGSVIALFMIGVTIVFLR